MSVPSITSSTGKMTNKLLAVGHPHSNLEFVIDVMQKCNVSAANNLEKEGIEAQEISKILLKAHGIDPDATVEQVQVNPVWNGLAMDLMMSNLEHAKWVWADSEALPFLDYWKSLDKGLSFVLVYNSPQQFLQNLIENSELDFEEGISEALQKWQSYNRAMLNFFYRNQERSLLVNSEQVEKNSQKYLQEVGKQIGLNHEEISRSVELVEAQKRSSTRSSDLYGYFVSQIVSTNDQAKQLYMELESIANLPSLQYENKQYPLNKVLSSYLLEQKEYQSVCNDLENSQINYTKIEQEKEELNKKLVQESKKVEEIQTENELQLAQLMSVQEELEKYYIEKKHIEEQLKHTGNELDKIKTKYSEIERQKEELSKKVQELQKQTVQNDTPKTKELEEENKLLLEQLHHVQEELEKFYLQNIELKKKNDTPNVQRKKQYYGASERIKQQLSYRLGALMIEKSKSFGGVLTLPFALYGETKKFRAEKASCQEKLPPLHTYADAYDAERIKKHLSYRLGQAMIYSMKSPLGIFKVPFALKKAHVEYKKERK